MLNVRKTFFEQKLMHNEYENYKIHKKLPTSTAAAATATAAKATEKKNFFQKIPNKNAVFGRNLEWEKQQNSISITILMLISFVEQCKRREMN